MRQSVPGGIEHCGNVADSFSKHFTRTAASESAVQSPHIPAYSTFFQFEPISEEDVVRALAGLNTTKATSVDTISARLLKTTAPAICSSLCVLFNYSLRTASIPAEWKAANVIPINP